MGIGTVIGGGLGLAQGFMGSRAASRGSQQMAQGNLLGMLLQQQMFQQAQQNLQPFMQYGQNALQTLAPLIGIGADPMKAQLTSRFDPTIERLEKTPGYKFTLDQGLRNLQNAFAAKGLGSSSNALRGAADYVKDLASTTFQQQFQNYWGENKSIYDMLAGAGNVGANAAGQGAGLASNFGQMMGQGAQGYGNALGMGTLGANNALWKGIGDTYGLFNANPNLMGQNSWWNKPLSNFFFNPFPSSYASPQY